MENPTPHINRPAAHPHSKGACRRKQGPIKPPPCKDMLIADYNGEDVDMALLGRALDFLMLIRRNADPPPDGDAAILAANILEYGKAKAVIRHYGHQIKPQTPQHIREITHSIVSSAKCLDDEGAFTIIATILGQEWQGIGTPKSQDSA